MTFETIDFSELDKNQQDEACDNHLAFFRNSPVMLEFRQALVKQSQELYDANISTLSLRTIEDSASYQLDVIGEIVGQPREPFGAESQWLTLDDNGTVTDESLIWLEGEPLGNLQADDNQYKVLIRAKIFKNHVKYGSIPEIIEFVRLVFGELISIKKLGKSDINLVLHQNFPTSQIDNLINYIDDEQSDKKYLLPLPTGTRILGVEFVPDLPFMPDSDIAGPDLGRLSVASIV